MVNMRARTSPIWKIDKEELEAIVRNKNSICEVLEHFGYNPVGGMHRILKQRCEEDGIDLIEIKRRAIDKRANGDYGNKSKYSNDELFVADSRIARKTIKRRLIQDGLIPYQCVECGIEGIWRDKSLSLVLDHINGLNNDNRLENLRFLCPNCNSQTETFAGRNSQNNWKKMRQDLGCIKTQKRNCEQCGKEYNLTVRTQRFCSTECSHKSTRKVVRPSKEELQKLIESNSWVAVGKIYNVSDKTIRKWAEKYEIQKSIH